MKISFWLSMIVLLAGCVVGGSAPTRPDNVLVPGSSVAIGSPLSIVQVESYQASFARGDQIIIEDVLASSASWRGGEILLVRGRYQLSSQPAATLALYVTTRNQGWTASSEKQRTTVRKGEGRFELECEMPAGGGEPHVSFYPNGGGDVLGGVYFRPVPR